MKGATLRRSGPRPPAFKTERPESGRSGGSGAGAHRHGSGDMRCGEMVEYLSDYLDGDLDTALRRTIDEHGGRCPPCRAFIRTLRATVEAVRALPRRRLGQGAVRSLALALRKASAGRR